MPQILPALAHEAATRILAPFKVTSTGGATEYVTLVAPDHTPPLFRIEDDPPPCAS